MEVAAPDCVGGNKVSIVGSLRAPYRFGGSGPTAFDCSGLVRFVHQEIGIDVPRTAAEQYRAAIPVKLEDLEPAGDLVFYGNPIHHTGMYIGGGKFISATTHERPTVQISELDDPYWNKLFITARRVK